MSRSMSRGDFFSKKSLFPCAFLLSIGCVTTAFSAVVNDAHSTTDFDQVIVSATRTEQTTIATPTNITVIDADAIERSGAQNLPDLLRSRAGIQVQDNVGAGSRGTTLVMRGFGTNAANNTLILLDGQKLNNPSLAAPDLSSIAIGDIERIEVVQGSAGVLFGDQATGGVINIITKRPQQRDINVEIGRGSHDQELYRASVGEGFDNGIAYRLSAEHKLADNYRDNNNSNYSNINFSGDYTNDMVRLFIEAQQVNDNLRLPGALTPDQIAQNRRQTTTPDDFSNRDTDRYRIGSAIALNPQWTLHLEYSYRDTDGKGDLFAAPFAESVTIKGFTPRITGDFDTPFGKSLLTLGYDQYASSYTYDSSYFPKDAEQTLKDEYAQLVVPVYTKLTATVGARVSHSYQDNHLTDSSKSDREIASSVGLSYQATDALRVFARKDSNFRWANADENASTLPGVEFLKPQTGDSYEIGSAWQTATLQASATLYRLITDNELVYDPAANGGFGANINLPRSRRNGINTELQWHATDAVALRASAGYVDAKVTSGNFDGETVPFVAARTGSAGIDWQIAQSINLYVDAQYTGRRYRNGDDPNVFGQLGGYTVYNANLRWQYRNVWTSLRVDNITAKKYEGFTGVSISSYGNYFYAYPAAERQVFATIGYKF